MPDRSAAARRQAAYRDRVNRGLSLVHIVVDRAQATEWLIDMGHMPEAAAGNDGAFNDALAVAVAGMIGAKFPLPHNGRGRCTKP